MSPRSWDRVKLLRVRRGPAGGLVRACLRPLLIFIAGINVESRLAAAPTGPSRCPGAVWLRRDGNRCSSGRGRGEAGDGIWVLLAPGGI